MGDFDGSSAHELLETIRDHEGHMHRVFIHTDCLREIHPFGKAVFHNNFQELNKSDTKFIFTGENGNTLAP
jgi:hypothetical protein